MMVDKLFQQVAKAAAQASKRDSEADVYTRRTVQQRPELLYNMVQTQILQHQALKNAKAQDEDPQRQADARQGPSQVQPRQPGRGQSFLAGAAETAVGVAGGMFLADAFGSLLDSRDYDLAADAVDEAYEAGLEDGLELDDDFGFDDLDFDF